MKKNRKALWKIVMCFVLSVMLFLQSSMNVFAINTKFDVPSIEKDWTPDNCLYKSPNLNIQVCKWGYGLVADILNTSDIDTLLAELHKNISPAGNKRSVLGIYMEGAGLSEANAADIAKAGWTELNLYYETFFVGGSAPTGAMTPSVSETTDANALAILENAGIKENIAMVSVSDVKMTWANYILYDTDFKFLKGKTLQSYKFIADLGVFVPIEETYFGSYGANFLELYDLQKAEEDVNGIYVTLTQSLPETIVVSAEQVIALREAASKPQPTPEPTAQPTPEPTAQPTAEPSTQPTAAPSSEPTGAPSAQPGAEPSADPSVNGGADATGILTVVNTDNTVEWKFANGQGPENFTAEATVKAVSESEVSVDFAYSGELPEGTEVTVQVPADQVDYQEEDTLYFYYCNPETKQRDFVDEGKYQAGQVTFQINHCSEYVITAIGPDAVDNTDGDMPLWPVFAVLGVVVCGAVGFLVFRKKK